MSDRKLCRCHNSHNTMSEKSRYTAAPGFGLATCGGCNKVMADVKHPMCMCWYCDTPYCDGTCFSAHLISSEKCRFEFADLMEKASSKCTEDKCEHEHLPTCLQRWRAHMTPAVARAYSFMQPQMHRVVKYIKPGLHMVRDTDMIVLDMFGPAGHPCTHSLAIYSWNDKNDDSARSPTFPGFMALSAMGVYEWREKLFKTHGRGELVCIVFWYQAQYPLLTIHKRSSLINLLS